MLPLQSVSHGHDRRVSAENVQAVVTAFCLDLRDRRVWCLTETSNVLPPDIDLTQSAYILKSCLVASSLSMELYVTGLVVWLPSIDLLLAD